MTKILFAFLLLTGFTAQAQTKVQPRTCGTPILPQQFETWVQSLNINSNPGKTGGASIQSVFNIPVIVHIIHNNEAVNSISATSGNNLNAAQVIDQINILNKDFNGLNADTNLIPSTFKPVLGKCQINFCLAVVNPTGGVLAEPGINRIDRVAKGWSTPPYSSNYVTSTIKPNSIWDPTKYLNIWVSPLSSGLLGFATFPNPGSSGLSGLTGSFGSSTTDGVVILNTSFGSIGTGQFGVYNKGRTATHEVGHWVGLRHIWGDSNCGTDYCNDTPPAQTSNYNCPTFPYKSGTCTGNTTGEMTMNFMDYTNDACMYMFTNDQKNRAQLILTNSTMRAALVTSTACNLPTLTNDLGISYVSKPTYSQVTNCTNSISPVVNVTNFGSSLITSALFTFNVDGVNTQTMVWTGSVTPNTSFTLALTPITNLSLGAHLFNVTVSAPNGSSDNNSINNSNTQQFSITGNLNVSAPSVSTCIGTPAVLMASGASSYSWSNGANGAAISVNPSLTTVYSVTAVTGACAVQKTVTVTVQSAPLISLSPTAVCQGELATLFASGATTYTWNNSQTGSNINVTLLTTDIFTVTGAFTGSCVSTQTFNVFVNPLPTTTVSASNLSCASCNDASISVIASGGLSPYTYTWVPGNVNTAGITDLSAGCYTVIVSDANGCKTTDSACVSFDTGIFDQKNGIVFVNVIPNPSSGLFVIDLNFSGLKHIEVIDLRGIVILKQETQLNSATIDLSAYPKAVYYVKVVSENKYFNAKIIKN
jgi:hypothetical protein